MLGAMKRCFASLRHSPLVGNRKSWHEFLQTSCENSQVAGLELERQNTRLKLLLDLTNRITSNLDLTEVLRAISGSVRQVMKCDLVAISLLDSESGQFRHRARNEVDRATACAGRSGGTSLQPAGATT
jgi:transcriptional regulator with GAF, ATPase, and Fis domain